MLRLPRSTPESAPARLAACPPSGRSSAAPQSRDHVRDQTREARWERGWRLLDHTGLLLKVTLFVGEADDSMIYIRVGEIIIASGTPPWIANRSPGFAPDTSIDIAQRHTFYKSIEAAIATALEDAALSHGSTARGVVEVSSSARLGLLVAPTVRGDLARKAWAFAASWTTIRSVSLPRSRERRGPACAARLPA